MSDAERSVLESRGLLNLQGKITPQVITKDPARAASAHKHAVDRKGGQQRDRGQREGGADGGDWRRLLQWRKDFWPMKFFQYGNAQLPDGENATGLLAVSTVAVAGADLQTSIWRTSVE